MFEYRNVYDFNVLNEVKMGAKIKVLDRETETIENIEDLTLKEALEMINSKENNRYSFWEVIEKQDCNETE